MVYISVSTYAHADLYTLGYNRGAARASDSNGTTDRTRCTHTVRALAIDWRLAPARGAPLIMSLPAAL